MPTPIPDESGKKVTITLVLDDEKKQRFWASAKGTEGERMRALRRLEYTDAGAITRAAREMGMTVEDYCMTAALQKARKDINLKYQVERAGACRGVAGARDRDLENAFIDILRTGKEPTPSILANAIRTGFPTAASWFESRRPAWEEENAELIAEIRAANAKVAESPSVSVTAAPAVAEQAPRQVRATEKRAVAETVDVEAHASTATNLSTKERISLAQGSEDASLLAILAEDTDRYVTKTVARNPYATAETLAKLAEHPDPYTRRSVKANPSAPKSLVAKLDADPDERVRDYQWPVAPATRPVEATQPPPRVGHGRKM